MKNALEIKSKVEILSSKSGRKYLGCNILNADLIPFLRDLEKFDSRNFAMGRRNQISRDGNAFHLTIISPGEFDKTIEKIFLDSEFIENNFQVDLRFIGVGQAKKNDDTAFYVVVISNKLDDIRIFAGLNPRDFHVTLAFYDRDVHGVCKNSSTLIST